MSLIDGSSETNAEPKPLGPDHPGVPVTLGDGRKWRLPYCLRGEILREHRDRFADAAWTGGKFEAIDVQSVAMTLLSAAYDEPHEVIASAILATKASVLLDAVIDAVLITSIHDETIPRTYSEWLNSGLIAAGLSRKEIPDELLSGVVKHLVDTKRMAPAEEFFSAAIGARVRANTLAQLGAD